MDTNFTFESCGYINFTYNLYIRTLCPLIRILPFTNDVVIFELYIQPLCDTFSLKMATKDGQNMQKLVTYMNQCNDLEINLLISPTFCNHSDVYMKSHSRNPQFKIPQQRKPQSTHPSVWVRDQSQAEKSNKVSAQNVVS